MLETVGLKKILEDVDITDVLINSSTQTLIERAGQLQVVEGLFQSEAELRTWIQNVFSSYGGRLDISQPLGELSLSSESGLLRIHAVLAGHCSEATQVSIRRHSAKAHTLQTLLSQGALTDQQLQSLLWIIRNRENFVIVGSTGAGKTTLLRAMLNEVSGERIITLEENYELALIGNAVALKTRENNQEGVGEISLNRLLRNALRMRPDRIVIGEARGEELLLLLQSLNTGHSGAGFTLHANSHREGFLRMLGILSFTGVSTELATSLIASAVHWIIEVRRENGIRKVVAIERLKVEL